MRGAGGGSEGGAVGVSEGGVVTGGIELAEEIDAVGGGVDYLGFVAIGLVVIGNPIVSLLGGVGEIEGDLENAGADEWGFYANGYGVESGIDAGLYAYGLAINRVSGCLCAIPYIHGAGDIGEIGLGEFEAVAAA